ncbi:hypothetical protein BVY03_04335 [bacterium K02(2017)]|nr:hypothetical protein BVY03_04335 [bacterium K02(2017)]
MNAAQTKKYLSSFACPACQSANLLLTKEKIIVCKECLNGYKIKGDIPDFRVENAISFKQKMADYKQGMAVKLTILLGKNKLSHTEIRLGHCVVLGRKLNNQNFDETTYVGRPQNIDTFTKLNPDSQKLVERCLSEPSRTNTNQKTDRLGQPNQQIQKLGNFTRDIDLLLEEASVSRSHAVVYHDEQGVHIIDLVSKNGTYVNGYEIEKSKLKNNDVISLGTASIRVQCS